MDRSDFYYRQIVTQSELDQVFDDTDNALKDRTTDENNSSSGHSTWGVWYGLEVAEQGTPDLTVQIADGYAYDDLGRRIPVTGGPATYSLVSLVPSTPGDKRYVRLYVQHDTSLSDSRTDGLGLPVDYRIADSFQFNVNYSATSPTPSKPSMLANSVCLATILLEQGMGVINDVDISMLTMNDATAPDRHGGGHQPRGKLLNIEHAINFDTGEGDVVDIGGGNKLLFAASTLEGSTVIATQSVGSYGINTAANQGHLYRSQTDPYPLIEIEKWLNYDASHLNVGENNNQHPWQGYGSVTNVFQRDDATAGAIGGGAVPSWDSLVNGWRCEINMPAGPYPKYSFPLLCPLVGLPHGCSLERVEFDIEVLADMTVALNVKYGVMGIIRRRGDDIDILSQDPPAQFQQASTGRYQHGEDISGGYIIDADNEEYYAAFYLETDDSGVFNGLRVCGARAKYLHREASGVY